MCLKILVKVYKYNRQSIVYDNTVCKQACILRWNALAFVHCYMFWTGWGHAKNILQKYGNTPDAHSYYLRLLTQYRSKSQMATIRIIRYG